MLRYARRPYGSIEENARQFGNCWTVRAPGQPPIVSFSDPDAIKVIFTADVDEVHGGEGQAPILGPILGWKSVLVLDGARHRRERRLLMPPFHGERMHLYGLMMREITDRVIDRWPLGQPFPVHREMQTITLDVILRAVFGLEEGAQLARVRDTLLRALKLFDGAAAAFLAIPALQMELGGLTPWGRFVRHRRDVDGVLRAEIARRRADGTAGRTDVLSMLVEARDEYGEPMTDQELLDEMFTILGAGHETTAISMSWALHHVLGRPDVLERIEAEHRNVAGEGPVEPDHLGKLEYLDALIKESARLTPVATQVLRRLKVPMRIGGWDLPAGINVSAAIYATHHRADLWPEPERFDPDRFVGTRPSPYSFFPFGGGERRCLGAAFASYEMKVVLDQVLSRASLRVAFGYRMRPVLRAITVAPSDGMPVVLDRRTG
ncbi:MAG: cytochrome P450 [Deltaproteobacteria bacterium]|nr:MAG: cytochrome P450 [Deltaproteobacteria bacterium]